MTEQDLSNRTQSRTRGSNRPTKRGGRWTIRWYEPTRHPDGTITYSHRRETFFKERDAKEALVDHLHRANLVKNGRTPPPAKPSKAVGAEPESEPTPGEDRSFNALCDYWLKHRMKRSKVDDESIMRRHLRPAFGELHSGAITMQNIDAFRLTKADLSPKTLRNVLVLLGSLFNYAVELKWIAQAPTIQKPKIPKRRTFRYLETKEEIRCFLEAAKAEDDPTALALYSTAILSGMRAGELAGLRWEDIDLARRQIQVKRSFDGPTKSGDERIVPIVDDLYAVLSAWKLRSPRGLVFTSKHGTMLIESGRLFQDVLKRVLKRGGFKPGHISFHSLRHTFASHWILGGGDVYRLKSVLGHSSVEVTQIYAHLSPTAYVEDHERLSGFLPREPGTVTKIGEGPKR